MPWVVKCVFKEAALLDLHRDTSALKELEYLTDVFNVFHERLGEDRYIDQVSESVLAFDTYQDDIHCSLKCSQAVL